MKGGPRPQSQRGSALLMVVLLVGAVLIFSVTVGVVFKRQLDNQRRVLTQASLETAWRGLFGEQARGTSATVAFKRQGNMRLDFRLMPEHGSSLFPSFTPPFAAGNEPSLGAMTQLSAVPELDQNQTSPPLASPLAAFGGSLPNPNVSPYYRHLGAWNGPYWNGSVDGSNRPVDGWGRSIQLRNITTGTAGWQVFSLGPNGADDTGNAGTPSGDDLAYPIPPAALPAFPDFSPSGAVLCAAPAITITRTAFNPAETLTLTITDSTGTTQTQSLNITHGGGDTVTFTFSNLAQGTITYRMTSSKSGNPFFRGPWPASGVYTVTLSSSCTLSKSI